MMHILIAEYDLFQSVGGGQTVYQNIVRRRSADSFYYFARHPEREAPPSNARVIPLRPPAVPIGNVPIGPEYLFAVYRDVMEMAASAYHALGKFSFDVIDTPDYHHHGIFIRKAFESHGLSVGRVALALHGTLSSAFNGGWPWTDDPSRLFAELRLRESLQYRAVDCRYAISQTYAADQQRHKPLPINLLDPLAVIAQPQLHQSEAEGRPADLVFIGRRERRKGPDLFLDLAWWLPRESYRRIVLIGEDGLNHQGLGSGPILEGIARTRHLAYESVEHMDRAEIRALCGRKTVVVVPSRYDQFNLVTLEALLDGCPVVVSRRTGVSRFIDERLPDLSWLIADVTCDRSAVAPLKRILDNYDAERRSIVEVLERARLTADLSSLDHIYDAADEGDRRAQDTLHDVFDRFMLFSRPRTSHRKGRTSRIKSILTAYSLKALRSLRRHAKAYLKSVSPLLIRQPRKYFNALIANPLLFTADHECKLIAQMKPAARREFESLKYNPGIRRNLVVFSERSTYEQVNKLNYLTDIVSGRRLDRALFFREMIRLERSLGNDLVAATYALRTIRWLGHDRFGLLKFIKATLTDEGYRREAEAAEAIYGDPARAQAACRAFLDDQLSRHRTKGELPFEMVDNARRKEGCRISVIVSLYNAADKLPTFLRMLEQQTAIRSGQTEIVFIDSGSPGDEYEVFRQLWSGNSVSAVFARSKERETIQSAWNRGIRLARGEYLAFLGVDEGLHPECLSILARELDQNPSVDWVIADSIVTTVDKAGIFDRDVMPYDRRGYQQNWHYLDSTFLSYVGGLYRRTIHDKHGYYDESFRAAGDTEFKNRILPFIQSKHIAKPLGVFNNYPEERMTHHPRAEIEDLRAWYLHRTVGGVSYAFDGQPPERVVELIGKTLNYKKCYFSHVSTDIDLARQLSAYLIRHGNAAEWKRLDVLLGQLLSIYQGFELLREDGYPQQKACFRRDCRAIAQIGDDLTRILRLPEKAALDVFNDNRYEQHHWSWRG